jgi:gamma-glutamyltranspeptidase
MRAPRFHPDLRRAIEATDETGDLAVQLEESETAAWPATAFERLKALGFQVESGTAFGRVHGIHFDQETGEVVGVADPRGTGGAVGPKPESLEEGQR